MWAALLFIHVIEKVDISLLVNAVILKWKRTYFR